MASDAPQLTLNKPVTTLGLWAWACFDWAHSAFPTVIITFIFSTYFTKAIAPSEIQGSEQWGWTMGIAGIVIAILAPFLGSIADYTGRRKPWLAVLLLLSALFTALLWLSTPGPAHFIRTLSFVAIATVTYELTQVFYNAMMVSIAPKDKIGRLSGWGWGFGYFGGLACLVIALFAFIQSPAFQSTNGLDVRMTTVFVAAWFLLFALPLFVFTPDVKKISLSPGQACCRGIRELWQTLKQIRQHKTVFLYLLAHLIYIDGLNTIFVFAGVFAAGVFHLSYASIVIFAIILNITAGLGAIGFAWIDDWLGPKPTIILSLTAIIISGCIIVSIKSLLWFWILGAFLGIFVGPVQAASRSYMAHIAPPQLLNQMFGIYQLSGHITAWIGPLLVAAFTGLYHSQRIGMASIFGLMIIGLIVLGFVPRAKAR